MKNRAGLKSFAHVLGGN